LRSVKFVTGVLDEKHASRSLRARCRRHRGSRSRTGACTGEARSRQLQLDRLLCRPQSRRQLCERHQRRHRFGQTAAGATTFGGGIAGGQGGCNFQAPNNLVYGFEVDAQASFPVQFGTAITTLGAVTNSLPVSGTVRGRIGYAPVSGVLLYATGGGGIGLDVVALTKGTMANPVNQVSMQTRGLWTVGAGVETAIYRNWTAKVEYLHLETGTTTANFSIMGVPSSVGTRLNENTVRVGVNYRF
jgi:outer membrane immunogenic protein